MLILVDVWNGHLPWEGASLASCRLPRATCVKMRLRFGSVVKNLVASCQRETPLIWICTPRCLRRNLIRGKVSAELRLPDLYGTSRVTSGFAFFSQMQISDLRLCTKHYAVPKAQAFWENRQSVMIISLAIADPDDHRMCRRSVQIAPIHVRHVLGDWIWARQFHRRRAMDFLERRLSSARFYCVIPTPNYDHGASMGLECVEPTSLLAVYAGH